MASDTVGDREVELMRLIVDGLRALDDGARHRVYRWFIDRFASVVVSEDTKDSPQHWQGIASVSSESTVAHTAVGLEALYAAARRTVQWERVLIAGYWLQEVEHEADFDAMQVNQEMRRCGYGVSNITRELAKLMAGRFVAIQSENGSSTGRRRFRVTHEGVRWCKQRLGQTKCNKAHTATQHFDTEGGACTTP